VILPPILYEKEKGSETVN